MNKIDKDTQIFIISFFKNPYLNIIIFFKLISNTLLKLISKLFKPKKIYTFKNRFLANILLLINRRYLFKYFINPKYWNKKNINYNLIKTAPFTGWENKVLNKDELFLINLAQKKFKIKNDQYISWDYEYQDSEDTMSLHRFDWLIRLLVEGNNKDISYKGMDWIISWINHKHSKNNQLIWDSYTVSERLINWTLFLCTIEDKTLFSDKFIKIINKSIYTQIKYLAFNLEFVGKHTNNHIINNARSLYIIGRLTGIAFAEKIGLKIIENETDNLMPGGVLKEASSHYQLMLTRSYLEIYWFAEKTNDKIFSKFLENRLSNMLRCCNHLTIKNNKEYEIPLFGDISPDYPPSWFYGYPFINDREYSSSPWTKIWGDFSDFSKKINKISEKNIDNNFIDNQWIRKKYKDFNLFLINKNINLRSHLHQDDGSVSLYYKNMPIIIDPGLISYVWKNKISKFQTEVQSHSVLLLNEIGLRPSKLSQIHPIMPFKESKVYNNNLDLEFKMRGFRQLGSWHDWNRKITFNNNIIELIDNVNGKGFSNIFVQYIFDKSIKIFTDSSIYGTNGKINFDIEVKGMLKDHTEISYDNIKIINGYQSKYYGDIGNCKILRFIFNNKNIKSINSQYNFSTI